MKPLLSEKNIAFVFGGIFVSAMIIMGIFFATPTQFQFFVFRIIFVLSAAGIGAVIPGLVNLKMEKWKIFILRVCGAVILFVLVYLLTAGMIERSMLILGRLTI